MVKISVVVHSGNPFVTGSSARSLRELYFDTDILFPDPLQKIRDVREVSERSPVKRGSVSGIFCNVIGLDEGGLVGRSILAECFCPLLPNPCYNQ